MRYFLILLSSIFLFCELSAQDRLSTQGILHMTEFSFCMDGCDQYYIEPDEGFEQSFVVDGSVWLLPYVGQHILVSGTGIWCVECGALQVNELTVLDSACDSDFNDDGNIDVLDIVLLVSCILETGNCTDCMDFNNDGIVDILDIISIISFIISIE